MFEGEKQNSEDNFQEIFVVETNIDDMTGEDLGFIVSQLQEKDFVLDVSMSPLLMKKGRPGWLIRVITKNDLETARFLLRHTSTFGVRIMNSPRHVGERREEQYSVKIQDKEFLVRIKIKLLGNEIIGWKPEFEDLAIISKKTGLPLINVRRIVEAEITKKIEKHR